MFWYATSRQLEVCHRFYCTQMIWSWLLDLHCLYTSLCSLHYTWNYFINSVYRNNNIYLNKLYSCIMEGVFYDDCNIGEVCSCFCCCFWLLIKNYLWTVGVISSTFECLWRTAQSWETLHITELTWNNIDVWVWNSFGSNLSLEHFIQSLYLVTLWLSP